MLPHKILKPRGSEMLFSASFMRYFFKNLISSKCKIGVVFGNLQQFLDSLVGRMTLIPEVGSGDWLIIVSAELVVVMVITLVIQLHYIFIYLFIYLFIYFFD